MTSRDRRLLSPVGDGRSSPAPGEPPSGRGAASDGASKPIGPILTAQHALALLPDMEAVLGSIFRDIEVRAYRPMAPGLARGGLLPRDHARVIVIDDHAYTGGAAWLDRGFKLFEYQRGVMHSKFALVDDDWCTIGTFNANPSRLSAVNEENLFVFDPAFVAQVADLFSRDRAGSRPVTRGSLAARSLPGKAADWLAHGALSLLDKLVKTSPD
ncbi:phospholipase D-like domain-containing protein [Sorangium sp. So ce590]|uniref:phospholipase D-like domain-containing protein n=1 Tax=Sorangium sp. So ce590 TaxID=3133317 RepID=UPI003F5FA400